MVNYVKHMNAAISRMAEDERLSTSHVSLYCALFYCWNKNRFRIPMYLNRDDVRQIARIGSMKLYYKCMQNLHTWGYIRYEPSRSFLHPSKVHMIRFDIPSDSTNDAITASTDDSTDNTQPTLNRVPSINSINITNQTNTINAYEQAHADSDLSNGKYRDTGNRKSNRKTGKRAEHPHRPENLHQAVSYFEEKKSTGAEAEKFYNYFESVGWRVGGRATMKDWHAAARNWIANIPNYNNTKHDKNRVFKPQLTGKKNYAEPF